MVTAAVKSLREVATATRGAAEAASPMAAGGRRRRAVTLAVATRGAELATRVEAYSWGRGHAPVAVEATARMTPLEIAEARASPRQIL